MAARLKQAEVLKRFKATHGDRYDYSRTIYRTSSRKVIIICRVHGEFQQEPHAHMKGSGCARCYYDRNRK